ncbi:MAG: O-antigen ligase domain-containing protein [Xenococcaceae cyanobacterium MO_188.B32]|nr:O-antigen ligase domain-containing protein [Xenococcaceae cyanobacterium MO_188.B32]
MPSSLTKSISQNLQPTSAWAIILGFFLFLTLCFLVDAGRILILIFPLGSLAIAIFLYLRHPLLYTGFTWWMWFVGPFIRRLIDYQSGHPTPGPWSLTPMLVTSVSFITLIRYLPKFLDRQDTFPFILSLGSVFYAFLLALIDEKSIISSSLNFLTWATPISFGMHIVINWRNYPQYSKNVQRVFLWGVTVMGLYGVWQYLVAPPWDRFWLKSVGNLTYGRPEPLGIRVWSTMIIPQKFAVVMMVGLLLLFIIRGNLRFIAAGVGYLAFLLTRARTAWMCWVIGLLILLPSLKNKFQMRIIASLIALAIVVVPLTSIEPFSTVIGSRLESFSDISNSDNSYQARLEGYNELIGAAGAEIIGKGLGTRLESKTSQLAAFDNGFLVMVFTLGWLGTIPYLTGIFMLIFKLLNSSVTGNCY